MALGGLATTPCDLGTGAESGARSTAVLTAAAEIGAGGEGEIAWVRCSSHVVMGMHTEIASETTSRP